MTRCRGARRCEIFEALGLSSEHPIAATSRFLGEQDMRLGAEHGVPVRIGVDRGGDPRSLFAAEATHVVMALRDVVPVVASVGQ